MRTDTRPRKDYPEKVCNSCGESYKPRQYNQVICSAECRQDIQHTYKRNWWVKNRPENISPRIHYKKDWMKANPGKEYTGREVKLWHSAKVRATDSGIDFDIEVLDIIIPDVCPVFKLDMKVGERFAPTLDRIDPAKGYIKGNIWVISYLANRIKTDANPEELKVFAKWVLKQ